MPRRIPEPLGLAIGARVRACRQARGLTLDQLSDAIARHDEEARAKFARSTLSDVERGVVRIEVHTLARIARGLGVRLFELTAFPEEDEWDAVAVRAVAGGRSP